MKKKRPARAPFRKVTACRGKRGEKGNRLCARGAHFSRRKIEGRI